MGQQTSALQRDLEEKRKIELAKQLPTMPTKKVVFWAKGNSFGSPRGPQPIDIYRKLTQPSPFPDDFIPQCRVTGKKGVHAWKFMNAKECSHWCKNGDLTIDAAKTIVRGEHIDGDTGDQILEQVYEILDSTPVAHEYTGAVD